MITATFTLADATAAQLRRTAARVRKPRSRLVREAIAECAARADKLSAGERQRMLDVLDRAMRRPPSDHRLRRTSSSRGSVPHVGSGGAE